jgi:hypothetical protein
VDLPVDEDREGEEERGQPFPGSEGVGLEDELEGRDVEDGEDGGGD